METCVALTVGSRDSGLKLQLPISNNVEESVSPYYLVRSSADSGSAWTCTGVVAVGDSRVEGVE